MDNKTMKAIGIMIARNAQARAIEEDVTANETIDLAPLLKLWKPGKFNINDIRTFEDKPYRCVQQHDSTANPEWTPVKAPALWANYHATDKEHALPFVHPTGAHDVYKKNEFMIWTDGVTMVSVMENNAYDPTEDPSGWKVAE